MSYRQFLIELCECFEGHPTSDHQGRLGLALVRAPGEVTAALADVDLVEPPDFDPQGWPDTFNETYVRFTNRDRKFKEDSVAYRDRGNFQVTQAIRSQVLSRPWVTRAAVATKIAWAAGRAAAMPVVTGTLRVRKSKASGLTPGGLFKLRHGDAIPRTELAKGMPFAGASDGTIHVIGPQGIFKPRNFRYPLSITTSPDSPYRDAFSPDGYLLYKYRGADPNHPDNVGLRECGVRGIPLVYFHGLTPKRGQFLLSAIFCLPPLMQPRVHMGYAAHLQARRNPRHRHQRLPSQPHCDLHLRGIAFGSLT